MTICVVTHDRTRIREIANKIIEVRDGQIKVFPDNYDEYLRQSEAADAEISVTETNHNPWQPDRPSIAVKKRQRKALECHLRNEHYRAMSPVNKRITEIEQAVESAAERITEIETMIADPAHYKDHQKVVAVNREYLAMRERVARLTAEWDGLTAEAERMKREYRRTQENLKS